MSLLLSICIPTYNRAHRLRVMLEAVLPQVAQLGGQVELWVSDNASTDETPKVVEEAKRLGPLNYSRNDVNLGAVANVTKCITELARGEFVWGLGDDDLLRPGAVSRVLKTIEANRHLNLFYLNFRHADYSPHWPAEALGGYDGIFTGPANKELSDRPLKHWHEMVRGNNFLCTQFYSYVIRRSVWQDYWRVRPRQDDYSDTRWTYPHSYMVSETVMNAPSYYIGDPVLTIFNGGQSWWEQRYRVMLLNFPGLLRAYEKNGLPRIQVGECAKVVFGSCESLLAEVLRGEAGPRLPLVSSYLRQNWRYREAWRVLARACVATGRPWPVSKLCRAALKIWEQLLRVRGKLRFEATRFRSALGRGSSST